MVSVDEDEDVQFHIPSPKVTTYGVTYNFDTPLALPQLWGTAEDEDAESEGKKSEDAQDDGSEAAHLTLSTGIVGGLAHPVQKATVEYEDGTEGEETVCCTEQAKLTSVADMVQVKNAADSGS